MGMCTGLPKQPPLDGAVSFVTDTKGQRVPRWPFSFPFGPFPNPLEVRPPSRATPGMARATGARYQSRMVRPWTLIDRVDTPEGPLELRQRAERDFMITVGGRVLMTSERTRSEFAVAELGCGPISERAKPRVSSADWASATPCVQRSTPCPKMPRW
jgi:hypothetical protein